MQSNANLTNTGSVPLCNVTIKVREERRGLVHTIERKRERGEKYAEGYDLTLCHHGVFLPNRCLAWVPTCTRCGLSGLTPTRGPSSSTSTRPSTSVRPTSHIHIVMAIIIIVDQQHRYVQHHIYTWLWVLVLDHQHRYAHLIILNITAPYITITRQAPVALVSCPLNVGADLLSLCVRLSPLCLTRCGRGDPCQRASVVHERGPAVLH